MRIQKVEAENFKLFTTKFQKIKDMDRADMVLLNGPNGYGKTSIFDIVEFCLTGEIKRILKYTEELAIAKNETSENKILISDATKPSYVRLYLEENEKKIEIEYFCPPQGKKKGASKDNNPHKIFGCFKRRIICNGEEIQQQDEFLKNIQLDTIKEFFDKCCFLSQDEHLQFLKEAKKSKAEAISFLFEIPEEWETERRKLEIVLDSLNNRRKKKDFSYIVQLEQKENTLEGEIQDLQEKINKDAVGKRITYQRLFEEKSIYWDQENVQFDKEMYERAQKEIETLLYFAEHKDDCKKYLFNFPYRNFEKEFVGSEKISYEEHPLEYAYRFYGLIKQEGELEKHYLKEKKYKELLNCIQEGQYEDFNWEFIRTEKLLEETVILEIQEKLKTVETLKTTHGILAKTMSSLSQTRKNLIEYAHTAMQHGGINDAVCPLCGAHYGDKEELDRQIEEETKVLNELSDDTVIQIQMIKAQVYSKFLAELSEQILIMLQDEVPEETYRKLQEVKKHKFQILETEKLLQEIEISLSESYQISISELNRGYNILLNKLRGKLEKISEDVELRLIEKDFVEKYEKYYDKEEEKFLSKSFEMLNQKREYIKFVYHDFKQKELSAKQKELQKTKRRKTQLETVIMKLESYKKALNEGIQEYKKKIIRDIEPLLYAYTAKILQQKFNGKSIFISADDKVENIQLINSITDRQDILYSMSSGQLSAVALSFLLCMNQVYGRHKACSVLLIDDPVQTIDDVNMVGFVDILRYEFADRQIFVSTHEQKFEWFLRYRYAKAGKSVKIFNMKEIMLQNKTESEK